ncbi:hypothetical protein J6590_097844 [Homalodisca vitripennis]|nr:hypothetical protein J6590_097844 [Homalodisca vitripennis]
MLICADSHGRDLAWHLNKSQKTYDAVGFVRPGGRTKQILVNRNIEEANLSEQDSLVILCGTNDVARNEADEVIDGISATLDNVKQTNIFLVDVPNRYDLANWSCVNHEVKKTNQRLLELSEKYNNVTLLEASKAERHLHTHQGLHFNYRGKKWLAEMIVSAVASKKKPDHQDRPNVEQPPPPGTESLTGNDSPVATRGEACLDTMVTNIPHEKYKLSVIDLPLSDHHVILVELVSCEQSDGVVPALMTFRVFSPNRISLLKDHMSTIDWSLLLSGQDATSSWNLFFGAILNLMEIYFPCKLQRCGKKWPKKGNTGSWYSPELHVLKNHVMTLHTIANCTKSPVDKQAYITARNQYKSAIRDAKKSTNEHFIDTSGNKTKAAWQVVKSLTRSSSSQSAISPSLEEFTTFYGGMVEELRQKIPSAPTSADWISDHCTDDMHHNLVDDLIQSNHKITQQSIAHLVGISKECVGFIIQQLGYQKNYARWVPRRLTDNNNIASNGMQSASFAALQ